jgi:hypothetical protein
VRLLLGALLWLLLAGPVVRPQRFGGPARVIDAKWSPAGEGETAAGGWGEAPRRRSPLHKPTPQGSPRAARASFTFSSRRHGKHKPSGLSCLGKTHPPAPFALCREREQLRAIKARLAQSRQDAKT